MSVNTLERSRSRVSRMIVFLAKVFLLFLIIVESSLAAMKTKCEVVKALRDEGAPDTDLRNWLCLVSHESGYRYDSKSPNIDGSTDFGIFHFNDKYSCGNQNGTSTSICWKLRTWGCADSCESMLNSDISNDANCAVRIQQCDGFKPWIKWTNYCSDVSGSQYDYSHCS